MLVFIKHKLTGGNIKMKVDLSINCETRESINNVCGNLDKAQIVPLKIVDNGVTKDVTNYNGIYNISKGQFCGAVISYYNLVQHSDYFLGFANALDNLNLKYKMKIAQVNNKAYADIEFINKNIKFDKLNEEFTVGVRLINSYDKSSGIKIMPMFKRLACANGMVITRFEETFSIKHISKLAKNIQAYVETRLKDVINQNDYLRRWVEDSMNDSIEWRICCSIIEKIITQRKHREKILKELGISIIDFEDKKTKKKSTQYIWDDDATKKDKFTRWEIYNAFTSYLTHDEQITPHVETVYQSKAQRILTTKLERLPRVEVKL